MTLNRLNYLLPAILTLAPAAVEGQSTLAGVKTSTPPTIDGVVSDAEWASAMPTCPPMMRSSWFWTVSSIANPRTTS